MNMREYLLKSVVGIVLSLANKFRRKLLANIIFSGATLRLEQWRRVYASITRFSNATPRCRLISRRPDTIRREISLMTTDSRIMLVI